MPGMEPGLDPDELTVCQATEECDSRSPVYTGTGGRTVSTQAF